MTWFSFALAGALCLALSRIVARRLLREQGDPLMFTAVNDFVAGIIILPFIFSDIHLPVMGVTWVYFALTTVFAFLSDWFAFRALRHIDVSVYQIIDQLRQPLLVVAGFTLFSEPITPIKVFGVLLITAGATLAVLDPRRLRPDGGVTLAILSMAFAAIAVVFVKFTIVDFSASAFASLELLGISALCIVAARCDHKRLLSEIRLSRWGLIAAGAFFGLSEVFDFTALQIGEVSRVVAVFQLSVIFTVLGGILILHERNRLTQKLIGTLLAVVGVFVLRI